MSIKQYFVSSFPDGTLMEADYSQLEIRALAELSGDWQLKDDLDSGVDLHTLNAANWKGKSVAQVTPEERRAAKTISFQLQYGASYKGIAKRMGIDPREAKRFITKYEARYGQVISWQRAVMEVVTASRKPSDRRSPSGRPLGKGVYKCFVTGRNYTFYERESKDFTGGTKVEFYGPEVKNYPVQGFATGDIVPMMLGKLMRTLMAELPEYKLVNTVHDSVLLDIPKGASVGYASGVLKNTLESVPHYLKEDYGYVAKNVFPVDVKFGKNWKDMVDMS